MCGRNASPVELSEFIHRSLVIYFFGYLFWRSHLQKGLLDENEIDGCIWDNLLADEVICCSEGTNHSSPETNNFPGEFPLSVLAVRSKTQPGTEGADQESVSNENRVLGIRKQFLAFCLGFPLLAAALCGSLPCLCLFGFPLESFGLCGSFHGLALEVGMHRLDVRRVHINQRGGAFRVSIYLWWERGTTCVEKSVTGC
jgi:hypothetical protein